jgi:hypothetical protein|tara:strand:- start:569 stop:982 length:414 start_codon:yes stop_codon:yes gene_type:complete
MRVVKILVAVMALLILVGIGLIVYGLQRDKAARLVENAAIQTTSAKPSAPIGGEPENMGVSAQTAVSDLSTTGDAVLIEPFGTINVDLAADETLLSFRVEGNRAFLHLTGPKGARIIVVSMADKAVLGQILLMKPNN